VRAAETMTMDSDMTSSLLGERLRFLTIPL